MGSCPHACNPDLCIYCLGFALSTERARAEKAENNLGACQKIMGDEIASLRSRLAERDEKLRFFVEQAEEFATWDSLDWPAALASLQHLAALAKTPLDPLRKDSSEEKG